MAAIRGMWQDGSMDANILAKHIVDQATGEKPLKKPNPRVAARGIAHKEAWTPQRRSEIAKVAAEKRWQTVSENLDEL